MIRGKKEKRNTKIGKKTRIRIRFGMMLIVGPETRPMKWAVYMAAYVADGWAGAENLK